MSRVGKLAEAYNEEIVSRITAAILAFGAPVIQDPAAENGVLPYTGGGKILGFAAFDERKGLGPDITGAVDLKYRALDAIGVWRKGKIWLAASASPAGDGITPGMRVALVDTKPVLPTLQVTVADHGSGTHPPVFSGTGQLAYTVLGPWGESALIGASATGDWDALTNYLDATIPGQDGVPQGTTYVQLYYSPDAGTTWHALTGHKIAFASLTDAATHVEAIKAEDDDVGTAHPPESCVLPEVGEIVPDTSTLDVTVYAGTEVLSGGDAGDEIKVELNLPA